MGYNLLINGIYWGYNPLILTIYYLPGTSKHPPKKSSTELPVTVQKPVMEFLGLEKNGNFVDLMKRPFFWGMNKRSVFSCLGWLFLST